MKFAVILCAFTMNAPISYGQTPLSRAEIFQGIYGSHYDPKTKIASWRCPEEKDDSPDGCMFVGDSTSKIELLESVQIDDGTSIKAYVLTSTAGKISDCHACAPMIGMGVFSYRGSKWHLDDGTPNVTREGAWGAPPDGTLVRIGPKAYGFMLTLFNGGQGYFTTGCTLLAQNGRTIAVLWRGLQSEDNDGDYDPTGREGSTDRIKVTAAYKFYPTTPASDHYQLEVISHGRGYGFGEKLVSQNWDEIYRFKDGKYQLVRHIAYRGSPKAKH